MHTNMSCHREPSWCSLTQVLRKKRLKTFLFNLRHSNFQTFAHRINKFPTNLLSKSHRQDRPYIQPDLWLLCLEILAPLEEYQLAYNNRQFHWYWFNWKEDRNKVLPLSAIRRSIKRSPSGWEGSETTVLIFGRSMRQLFRASDQLTKGKRQNRTHVLSTLAFSRTPVLSGATRAPSTESVFRNASRSRWSLGPVYGGGEASR